MKATFVAVALMGLLALAAAADWSNCGTSADHLQNLNVVVSPNPPQRGQVVSVTVTGNLNEQITAGTVSYTVSVIGIPVISKTKDLCTAFTKDVTCPIAAGAFKLSIDETIPSIVPAGTYTLEGHVYDQNHQEVACLTATLNVQ